MKKTPFFSKCYCFTIGAALGMLLLATSLNAEQKACCRPMFQKEDLLPGYNASSRIEIQKSSDVFATGSFIYWQPIQENMQLGVVSDNSNALDLVNGYELSLDGEYRPGFKVGLGMNLNYDKWQSYLEYTWFYANEHAGINLDPDDAAKAIFPAWQIPDFLNPQYSSASELWKLHMNLLDWDLAREYYVGTELCFRTFFGLRGAWISQTVDIDYVNTDEADLAVWPSTHIVQSSDSWAIGPRLGVVLHWNLCNGFKLVSGGEWDVLFTQYTLKNSQISDMASANQYIVNQHNKNYLRAHTNLNLGLGWGSCFLKDRYHIDLLADYCFQVFFDQNMFRTTINAQALGKSIVPNGNLYLHGLTVTIRFGF